MGVVDTVRDIKDNGFYEMESEEMVDLVGGGVVAGAVMGTLGAIGGGLTGAVGGAAVGTVTLPIVGTVSGTTVGLIGGAISGATAGYGM